MPWDFSVQHSYPPRGNGDPYAGSNGHTSYNDETSVVWSSRRFGKFLSTYCSRFWVHPMSSWRSSNVLMSLFVSGTKIPLVIQYLRLQLKYLYLVKQMYYSLKLVLSHAMVICSLRHLNCCFFLMNCQLLPKLSLMMLDFVHRIERLIQVRHRLDYSYN